MKCYEPSPAKTTIQVSICPFGTSNTQQIMVFLPSKALRTNYFAVASTALDISSPTVPTIPATGFTAILTQ
jgi:hypothetical protein